MLLELVDDMIGDRVTLILGQGLLETTDDLAGPAESESETVSEHVPSGQARCWPLSIGLKTSGLFSSTGGPF